MRVRITMVKLMRKGGKAVGLILWFPVKRVAREAGNHLYAGVCGGDKLTHNHHCHGLASIQLAVVCATPNGVAYGHAPACATVSKVVSPTVPARPTFSLKKQITGGYYVA